MGWTKYFADGTSISEPASWSQTSLSNLIAVELIHNGIRIALTGLTEYWQSDRFVFTPSSGKSEILTRRISQKLPDGKWRIYEITGIEKLHYLSDKRL